MCGKKIHRLLATNLKSRKRETAKRYDGSFVGLFPHASTGPGAPRRVFPLYKAWTCRVASEALNLTQACSWQNTYPRSPTVGRVEGLLTQRLYQAEAGRGGRGSPSPLRRSASRSDETAPRTTLARQLSPTGSAPRSPETSRTIFRSSMSHAPSRRAMLSSFKTLRTSMTHRPAIVPPFTKAVWVCAHRALHVRCPAVFTHLELPTIHVKISSRAPP